MNCNSIPRNREQAKHRSASEQRKLGTLLSLSWYANEASGPFTLRYPGVQRHGSGAVQA
jgi:hypothetical protein